MKTKYVLGTLAMGMITLYSMNHPEKYHIVIPGIFVTLTILSIILTIIDKK